MKGLFLIFLLFFIATTSTNAQCSNELITRGKSKLGDATYISDYKVLLNKSRKRKPAYVYYKVKLEKNKLYRFVTTNDVANENPLVAKLSDDYTTYASSYNKIEQKDKGGFEFLCKKTQNYYLTCFYKDGTKGCGAVLFSVVKTYTKY